MHANLFFRTIIASEYRGEKSVWRSLETLATIGFVAMNGTWLIFSQLRPAEFSTRRLFHPASELACSRNKT
jgi:hypothetical protein